MVSIVEQFGPRFPFPSEKSKRVRPRASFDAHASFTFNDIIELQFPQNDCARHNCSFSTRTHIGVTARTNSVPSEHTGVLFIIGLYVFILAPRPKIANRLLIHSSHIRFFVIVYFQLIHGLFSGRWKNHLGT